MMANNSTKYPRIRIFKIVGGRRMYIFCTRHGLLFDEAFGHTLDVDKASIFDKKKEPEIYEVISKIIVKITSEKGIKYFLDESA